MKQNIQTAPYPEALERLVLALEYRPGWRFALVVETDRDTASAEASGLTLYVITVGYDTYHPEEGQTYRVRHHFPVPAATYNEQSWRRWLLDCVIKVETHEACEFFQIDGERPYAPQHGPGNDPYIIFEQGDDVERRTNFKGELQE